MDEIVRCGQIWTVLPTGPLEFSAIGKEVSTQGKLYIGFDNLRTVAFVSQSAPLIPIALHRKTNIVVHLSSLYRVVREEQSHFVRKGWKVKKYHRSDLEEFNRFIQDFSILYFVSKNLDLYEFRPPEPAESQNFERTCPPENEPSD